MSKSHIAYGPKDAIGTAVAKKLIPTNCLVITKVNDPTEEAEMLYFDSDYVSHQISARHMLDTLEDMMEEATTEKERNAIRRCMEKIRA